MVIEKMSNSRVENHLLTSVFLQREVKVDCFLPVGKTLSEGMSLLLINDGQDLVKMDFNHMLESLYTQRTIEPIFCVGIHCSADRKNEYGTAGVLDYQGLGAKAALYTRFIFEELLPFIRKKYSIRSFKEKSFAGFSLGGLSALDIAWKNSEEFTKVGVFSGSLWWRDRSAEAPDFNEETDRIMHRQIREGNFAPWLNFFFEVGTLDETADRNNNGIIDTIDDTIGLIDELEKKGYDRSAQIRYLELQDGKHDVSTWARAFPEFLQWGWGK
ncbi:esterase [Ferruginibacter lapsinanis]|uniref:alpha/beta hydrolase n=1 Tax=Ferruginibacter lapsinanis TaxID=563172 RepID=UPI001E4D0B60|nr:alpha/beta hydrolase-fold protein [Ferruginibacter lapsinanis]UEG48736.1 esterase [Ferruginibacter lapsinanis]